MGFPLSWPAPLLMFGAAPRAVNGRSQRPGVDAAWATIRRACAGGFFGWSYYATPIELFAYATGNP
ncbi:hypothetical protein [Archangium lansingense]|uniref:Uncharacterized protein n=1 Tax=Archangium lansingense TaxID=2995310 RepID=A0ABT4A0C3_9BACT|nr:hypothetical protein [Archangium lansinium]MCY1075106.1 hypothetical protein [Archangium lansinium]